MKAAAAIVAEIDGSPVEVHAGETILETARRAGIDVPTLCHAEGLAPEGGCRMCLVEIEGQRPQASCHTPMSAGMKVRTRTPRLVEIRRELLRLTLMTTPAGVWGPSGSPGGASKFERLLDEYGVRDAAIPRVRLQRRPVDESHPYMRFDRDRCITCRLCLNTCEQVQGQFVYGVEGRGGGTRLVFGPGELFAESECVSCGACVENCPTGAITDRDRINRAPEAAGVTSVDSVCGYCGVGCRTRVESSAGVVLRIEGVPGAEVNHGHLCVKGRYAHAYHRAKDRLTTPMIREGGGGLRPVSWEQAIEFTARRLREIRDRHGPDALGTMTSSRSTNEASYLLQKLFRGIIGTNNTDCCARVCHSSTAIALGLVTGTGAATASYADLQEARLIVVAGSNSTEAHPVVGARIKQAALRGAALVVIDPREIELARYASVHLPVWPGGNVAVFNALTKVILEEELFDRSYVETRCEGLPELRAFLASRPLSDLAAVARIEPSLIRRAARLIAANGPGLFISGLGLSEQSQGVSGVMAYCNLGLLTGSLGRRGAGMLPLRGQNNVQGNADMGAQPYALTGYLKLDDREARDRFTRIWGATPPGDVGLTIPEMYDAAVAGRLKSLWIQGEDVAQSDPQYDHVVKALRALDLLVVQELFMTETASLAHVVFPAAAVLEQEGTFTNGERRVQHVRAAVAPPGSARPDWEVIRDVGIAMGGIGAGWKYPSPASVFDEVAAVAPHLFGGISYKGLGPDGVQWPCPTPGHPGTRTVHTDQFVRGRALLTSVDYLPPLDCADAQHPHVLMTGRVLDHYNVGTMTRRTPSSLIAPKDYLDIHPEDAARLGISEGSSVRVRSHWGQNIAPARLTRRVLPGTSFLTFHFPETGTNRVVGPCHDPTSHCPDYKVVAVSLAPA